MNKFVLIFLLIFSACGYKYPNQDNSKNELLAYTQKYSNTDESFLMIASYLNPVLDNEFLDEENIVLAIYPKSTQIDLKSFVVNDQQAQAVLSDQNDEFVKLAPIEVPWGKYIKIKAKSQDSPDLHIKFNRLLPEAHGISRPVQESLTLKRNAKSLYWNAK